MKIIIDTAHQRFGGAVQVAQSFIHECRAFPEHDYHVWVGSGVKKSLNSDNFPDNFHFRFFDFGPITFWKAFRINRELRKAEKVINPDVIIATSGPTYFHSRAPQIIGYNLPLYIYPESPYLKNWSFMRRLRFAIKKWLHFYFFRRDAAAYVVQTDDVNLRVRKELKSERVHTVTNTCSGYYRGEVRKFSEKLPKKKEGVFRWLTVSSYYGHKNLEIIPEVLDYLEKWGVEQVEFVLTLKEGDFNRYIGPRNGLVNIGPVPPEECPSLYEECDGMFLPTLAECFSASYPEAMAMEKPILTTDLGFARSICGEAAIFFEPSRAGSAASGVKRIIEDQELRQNLIANGKKQLKIFDTPQDRARKYLEICGEVTKNRNL